jgi:hypothetical protein
VVRMMKSSFHLSKETFTPSPSEIFII